MQRATYEYLRGKILDVFPDYRKEAEDHLSKAVSWVRLLSIIFYPSLMCLNILAKVSVEKMAVSSSRLS